MFLRLKNENNANVVYKIVDYDYTQKRHIVCQRIVQRIVIVIWTNGLIYIPLAFAFWHQKERYYGFSYP